MSPWYRRWRSSGCRPESGKTAISLRYASFRWAAPGLTQRLLSRLSRRLIVPCNRYSVWRKACSALPGWTILWPPFFTARGALCLPWMKFASLTKRKTTLRLAKRDSY